MACNDPLRGFVIWINGHREIKVTGRNIDHLELYDDGVYRQVDNGLISPYCKKYISEYIDIPCGRCMGCRLDYSKMWADRMMLELQYHDESKFLTLTYADEHITWNDYVDKDGVIGRSMTLVKKDLQDFIKRLRKRTGLKLMYYACGEYGDSTARPHYHAVVFGLSLPDLKYFSKSRQGHMYYTSDLLNDIWSKGYVIVANVTYETCAYTARYVTKKQYGKAKAIYKELNIEPEFATMSLKPAIAKRYYEDNLYKIANQDYVYVSTEQGSKAIKPTKYYHSMLERIDKDLYDELKKKNEKYIKNNKEIVKSMSDLEYYDILEVQENVLKDKVKSLRKEKV